MTANELRSLIKQLRYYAVNPRKHPAAVLREAMQDAAAELERLSR